ncbi:MinD/ParA family protein [Streptomyces sp. NPDC056486]|uniref:MinD/ParA family ATP-binding protein n=1 Tax=Streptomyces sp. NPDC056486 TaxID=3345835 RepID=UPI0036BE9252
MRQIVALGSFKGAPGVTTLALALSAAWPPGGGARPIVVEADADGGDLAVRFGLPDAVGLLALAAGARQGGTERGAGELDGCAQNVAGSLRVVVAPTGGQQAEPCVVEVAARPSALRGDGDSKGAVLLDLGRLGGAPSEELARVADRVVLVARGEADALAHVAARSEWLVEVRPELVVMGECRYSEADIAQALRMERDQIHLLPWDARAAAVLVGAAHITPRRWGRARLFRAAVALAGQLAGADIEPGRGGLCSELAQFGSGALPPQWPGRPAALPSVQRGEMP